MNKIELLGALAGHLSVSISDIGLILKSAPYRYRHYQIEKRSGGFRDIHHPTPELKAVQRWLVDQIISRIPVHGAVYSYRSGRGIRDNAQVHARSKYFLKMDLRDFFPSIRDLQVKALLQAATDAGHVALGEDAIKAIARFACRHVQGGGLCLSIGAPSSPAISNAILFDLDSRLSDFCLAKGVRYSRYADDMCFSSNDRGVLADVETRVRQLVEGQRFVHVNADKTRHLSKKGRVVVTGLVATSEGKVSIGRGLKRKLKTELYLYFSGAAERIDVSRLRGYVSYSMGVEPAFFESLCRKFGADRVRDFVAAGTRVVGQEGYEN